MSAERFRFTDGVYLVDWAVVRTIIRSSVNARLMLRYCKKQTTTHFIGPDVSWIAVDWDAVHQATASETARVFSKWKDDASRRRMIEKRCQLGHMVADAHNNRAKYEKMAKDAQHETMANINTSVHRGEVGKWCAEAVRDRCKDIFIIGATIVAGPEAAWVAKGASAVLDAAIDYQDHHNLGNASLTLVGNFAVSFIPEGEEGGKLLAIVGKRLAKSAGHAAVDFAKDATTALVRGGHVTMDDAKKAGWNLAFSFAGESVGESKWLRNGAGKVADTAAFKKVFHSSAFTKMWSKVSCPLKMKYQHYRFGGLNKADVTELGMEDFAHLSGNDKLTSARNFVNRPFIALEYTQKRDHNKFLESAGKKIADVGAKKAKTQREDWAKKREEKERQTHERLTEQRKHHAELRRMPSTLQSAVLLDNRLISSAITGPLAG